jgi:hypothetical protein
MEFALKRLSFTALLLSMIVLPSLFSNIDVSHAQLPESSSPPAPIAPESLATAPTTTITRAPSPSEELNTLLMHATFLIVGPTKKQNEISFGTLFAVGIPFKSDPKAAHIVFVTAAHVFESISGDKATLQLRRKSRDGTYEAFGFEFPIRKDGRPLYVRHPTADVAAMFGDIPNEVPMTGLSSEFFVTDKSLARKSSFIRATKLSFLASLPWFLRKVDFRSYEPVASPHIR